MSAPVLSADELHGLLGPWEQRRHSRHRALAAAVGDLATRGVLRPGSRLPAERALASALGVSRGTVVAAYDLLVTHDAVVRRHGSGTYVSTASTAPLPPSTETSATARMERWLVHPEAVVDLTMTVAPSPDELPPLDVPTQALLETLPSHGYVFDGLPALRRTAANHLNRQGASALAHEVIITCGAQQAITLTASCLLRPGDVVAVETPSYPGALAVFTRVGARIVPLATDEAGVRPDALANVLRQHQPALVYLMPTAHNPLGTILPAGRREEVLRLTALAGVTVIEDLTQADIWRGDRPPPAPLGAGGDAHVVVIGSTSKVLWGGLRIGWLRARGQLFARLAAAKAAHDFTTSIPSQVIANELLNAADDAWLARRRALFSARHTAFSTALREALPAWRWREPDGGLGLWVDLGAVEADRFAAVAARHGVAVMPGPLAGIDGSGRHHVRLAFSLPEPVLASGVERLAAAWDALQAGADDVGFRPTPV